MFRLLRFPSTKDQASVTKREANGLRLTIADMRGTYIASVRPGATEVCDDGVDNDCDGLVDTADPACQTGTCDLGASGDFCASDGECCSAKCKGKPGSRTCR